MEEGLRDQNAVASFPAWRILVTIALLAALVAAAGAITCFASAQCRSRVPTLANMMEFPLTLPYAMIMLCALAVAHCVLAAMLYWHTKARAPRWSGLQAALVALVYISCAVVLLALPATGWRYNWVNVIPLTVLGLWMAVVSICLRIRGAYVAPHGVRALLAMLAFYALCVVIYVILRAVPLDASHTTGRDAGLLVVEVGAALAVAAFAAQCVIRTRGVTLAARGDQREFTVPDQDA